MLAPVWIALFAAVGAAGWIYARVQRQSGGASMNNSLLVAGVSGVILWLLLWYIHSIIF